MLATLSVAFTNRAEAGDVLPAADKERVAQVLEDDAEVMSNTQLEERLPAGRRRSSGSTPTRGRSPFRSPCSSRSGPVSSAS
jgi:hypothetical protein